jgi:hypothetical protein
MQRLRQTSGERNFCANTRESGELIHITCVSDVVNFNMPARTKTVKKFTLITGKKPPLTVFLTSLHDLAPPITAKEAR